MTMLPIITNQVRPWFEKYGATLDDRPSFSLMIDMAVDDATSLETLMPQYRECAADIAAECEAELTAARDLVERMRARLAELEKA